MMNHKLVAAFVGVAILGAGFAFAARTPESTRAAGVATNDPTARQATGWVTAFWRHEDFDRLTPEKQARVLANDPPPIGKEAIDAEAEYMRTTTDGRPADSAPEVEPPHDSRRHRCGDVAVNANRGDGYLGRSCGWRGRVGVPTPLWS